MFRILAYIALLAGGIYLIFLALTKRKNCTEEATGTVLRVIGKSYRSRGRTHRKYHPMIEYVANGKRITEIAEVSSAFRGKYKEGSAMEIRYNPDKPEEFIVKGNSFFMNVLAGLFLILIGVFGLYLTFIK